MVHASGFLKALLPVCYISNGRNRNEPPRVAEMTSMSGDEQRVCDAQETRALIVGMAEEIWNGRRPTTPFHLVGVRTRGVPLAPRLAPGTPNSLRFTAACSTMVESRFACLIQLREPAGR